MLLGFPPKLESVSRNLISANLQSLQGLFTNYSNFAKFWYNFGQLREVVFREISVNLTKFKEKNCKQIVILSFHISSRLQDRNCWKRPKFHKNICLQNFRNYAKFRGFWNFSESSCCYKFLFLHCLIHSFTHWIIRSFIHSLI